MIKGIGIDIVSQSQFSHLLEIPEVGFIESTFSSAERREAAITSNQLEYYSSCFAVKEAYFKAVNGIVPEEFDPRRVETEHDKTGRPSIAPNELVRGHMADAGISKFHLSISHDGGYTVALVIAEGDD